MCCATCRMFSGTSGFAMPKMHQNSNLAVLWCWQRAWSFSVAVTQAPTSSSSPAFPFSVEVKRRFSLLNPRHAGISRKLSSSKTSTDHGLSSEGFGVALGLTTPSAPLKRAKGPTRFCTNVSLKPWRDSRAARPFQGSTCGYAPGLCSEASWRLSPRASILNPWCSSSWGLLVGECGSVRGKGQF